MQRFHSTNITLHLSVIPDWNPYNTHATTKKTTSLWIIFPSHKRKTTKPCFRWLAAFIPSWIQSGRGKLGWRDESGKTAALIRSLAKPTACHAFCMMLLPWPEIRVWRATVKFWRNYIICDTSFFLCCSLTTRLVASTAGDLATNRLCPLVNRYLWLTSKEKETSYTS